MQPDVLLGSGWDRRVRGHILSAPPYTHTCMNVAGGARLDYFLLHAPLAVAVVSEVCVMVDGDTSPHRP
eukprot:11374943-Prorocentrum_lima.AAC.1